MLHGTFFQPPIRYSYCLQLYIFVLNKIPERGVSFDFYSIRVDGENCKKSHKILGNIRKKL